jgi:UDP-N-acetylmuramoyl-tripeptide--D-alanyl-D-alanine ligase
MAMPLWTHADITDALQTPVDPFEAHGVSSDSREDLNGKIFVALEGERFDGHAFVADSFRKGARAALVRRAKITPEMRESAKTHGAALIPADDTLAGLQRLAAYRRTQSRALVFAVTGSVGKTSTKEMLHFLLSHLGRSHAAVDRYANYNNHIGMPLTLANMPKDAQYAVLEMGMNHAGELTTLAAIAQPDVAVITTVAPVHLAFFPNMEGVALAKAEVLSGLDPERGVAVVGVNHHYADVLAQEAERLGIRRYHTVGTKGSGADSVLKDYMPGGRESVIGASLLGREIVFRLGLPGEHHAHNALVVLTALQAAGIAVDGVIERLADMAPGKGRGKRITAGGLTVIDDTYNAGPLSVCAAIRTMREGAGKGKRLFAALGDMLELGEGTEKFYRMIALEAAKAGLAGVYTVGKDSEILAEMLPEGMHLGRFPTSDALAAEIARLLPKDADVLLVKGSRGMRMEKVVEALCLPRAT